VTIWLDNHLSPAVATWISSQFDHPCVAVRDLGLAQASDMDIFQRAREADVILVTKDRDFAELIDRLGPPPKVIWLTFGNTSTPRLIEILGRRLSVALDLLADNGLVEISGAD
jgi:predicted nuclease of predicted toxin-antitoxin system